MINSLGPFLALSVKHSINDWLNHAFNDIGHLFNRIHIRRCGSTIA